MSAHESEFRPGPFDATTIELGIRTDLAAFNAYVDRDIQCVRLFGAIVHKLSAERPGEVHVDTDISSGKVGLQIAEMTGILPRRLTDPDTPIIQTVDYPLVGLPDGNHALLSEIAHRRRGIDSEVVVRIPRLCIIPEELLVAFRNGEIDDLSGRADEVYYLSDFDTTGRTDGEAPFYTAHKLFFLHPLGQEEISELEEEKQQLLERQNAYVTTLQAIASVVLDVAQEG
ncbi:MAG TPA: hypothetical protein VLF43_01240 [Candidatus Saccharimonadales bacterium]|nr:hypothetical protein [Candidatus Saccharimonadales bacterium]